MGKPMDQRSRSAELRQRLEHPVIDIDAHTVEFMPAILDYLRQVGGPQAVQDFSRRFFVDEQGPVRLVWYELSAEQRGRRRVARPGWWGLPTENTLDRATSMFPRLQYERLDEMGIDFAVIYPTLGLSFPHVPEDDLRGALCRAINTYHADVFREFSDRLTVPALVPMHTPQEAIEELEHAVTVLGLKTALFAGYVERPVDEPPDAARHPYWYDTLGLDSEHDYDPFWARCAELNVVPASHANLMGLETRRSISSYCFNHIGMFSAAHEALCKSLFMGGVTRRFPTLNFAFLEGGVGWALSLLAALVGHWEKRNLKDLERYNPANLDGRLLVDLFKRYGADLASGPLDDERALAGIGPLLLDREDPATLNEWAACEIERREDIHDLFVPRFYFGCEPDDPMNTVAFDPRANPFGVRLNSMFGSDAGHWDCTDMTTVLEEVFEQREDGRLTDEDLHDFLFANAARLYSGANPDFFRGTAVEAPVERMRAGDATASPVHH